MGKQREDFLFRTGEPAWICHTLLYVNNGTGSRAAGSSGRRCYAERKKLNRSKVKLSKVVSYRMKIHATGNEKNNKRGLAAIAKWKELSLFLYADEFWMDGLAILKSRSKLCICSGQCPWSRIFCFGLVVVVVITIVTSWIWGYCNKAHDRTAMWKHKKHGTLKPDFDRLS